MLVGCIYHQHVAMLMLARPVLQPGCDDEALKLAAADAQLSYVLSGHQSVCKFHGLQP
jgi:hypothetical protein